MKFEFGRAKLKHGMMARGLTQGELARLAGVSDATIASALAGNPVTMVPATRIANALRFHPPRPELVALLPDLPTQPGSETPG